MMMKVLIPTILAIGLFFSCKSNVDLSSASKISTVNEKLADTAYTFVPRTAIPVGGKNVTLDNSYSLKITRDTIEAYLPYFGRAYTAPYPTGSGGIKFSSTDFIYAQTEKKKGMWDVAIEVKDQSNRYKLLLSIGESGYGTLFVQEVNRQSISFYGMVE